MTGSDYDCAIVVFITSNVLGSLAQIASLPVVILAPLGAVSLLWNALFARLLLRPPLILGTALIGGGAALIAVYGVVPGPERTRSLNELIALFARPAFLAWFCVEAAVVVVCLIITHIIEYSLRKRLILQGDGELGGSSLSTSSGEPPPLSPLDVSPVFQQVECDEAVTHHTHERTSLLDSKKKGLRSPFAESGPYSRTPFLVALAYAAASGIMSGLCLIFAKSGVELLLLTLGGSNQFYRWEAWMLVGGLIVFALGQLWYLNKGLRLADPAFVCPSAFCFYNFSSILNGLVYFDQIRELPGLNIGLVIVGMVILLGGVWSISAEAGVEQVWSDEAEEDSGVEEVASSVDSEAVQPPLPATMTCGWIGEARRPTVVPMDRSAYSDGAVGLDWVGSVPALPSGYEPLMASSCGRPNRKAVRSYTEHFSPSTRTAPSRRRSTTVVEFRGEGGSRMSVSSSVGAVGGQVISPGGLTIGLSPMSPGFGVVAGAGKPRPSVLGVRGEEGRRRMVGAGEGRTGGSHRWSWVGRVVGWAAGRRANQGGTETEDHQGDQGT
ncbi:hypothetical protein J3A83DRAFT_3314674 [Scleroderma citrinum]